jgi:hypothetical protein
MPLLSSSTSSSSPSRSPYCLPPRNKIAATIVNASSSSPHPLSLRLPPTLTGSKAICGTQRSTFGARGPCPTPVHGPHPPGVIRTRPSAATDGLQVAAAATAMPAAVALPTHCSPTPPPPCHCHAAIVSPAVVLPLMMLRCRRAAKLAAAAALLPRFPPRCCQASRRRRVIITAMLLPPPCCRAARHRRPAAPLLLLPSFLSSPSPPPPPPPPFRQRRRAAADALPQRCWVGRSFWRLVGRLIGWLVSLKVSSMTSLSLTFRGHDHSPNLDPNLDRAKNLD